MTEYGLGAIFGCPAHDQRDLEFANEYNLEVIPVVKPTNVKNGVSMIEDKAFTEEGEVINSEFLNGLNTKDAKNKILEVIEKNGIGSKKTNYKLRDWEYQDKRFWGALYQLFIERMERL